MDEKTAARIQLGVGNLVLREAQAIGNPVDSSLTTNFGPCGAIHRAAGPELMKACQDAGPLPEGSTFVSPGFRLPIPHVIHFVVPTASQSVQASRNLRAAYKNLLKTCERLKVRDLTLPPAPMSPKGFPRKAAARLALETIAQWLPDHAYPQTISVCCFTPEEETAFTEALEGLVDEASVS